jgi:hypothetical protein
MKYMVTYSGCFLLGAYCSYVLPPGKGNLEWLPLIFFSGVSWSVAVQYLFRYLEQRKTK